MFRVFFRIALGVSLALSGAACTKATLEAAYAKQSGRIEAFVKKQLDAYGSLRVEYRSESTRIVMSEGTGDELSPKGLVLVTYAGYDFSGGNVSASTLFVTNSPDVASGANWELTDESVFKPVVIDLGDGSIYKGLRSGLKGVRAGEECYILFTGKYASPKDKIGTIPANAPLAFHVWVEDIEN